MRSAGLAATPGVFSARLWVSARHDLEFYPNAISLCPDVTAPEAVAARELPRRYAVKDSFARLDLAAEGLTLVFEAEWIACSPPPAGPGDPGLCWDAVTGARELSGWERAWAQRDSADQPLFRPELLADPRCAVLACRRDDTLDRRGHHLRRRPGDRNLQPVRCRACGRAAVAQRPARGCRTPARPAHRRVRARHRPGICPASRMPGPRPAPRLGARSRPMTALQTSQRAGHRRPARPRAGSPKR